MECGSGRRGAHALVHRPRTQSRAVPDTLVRRDTRRHACDLPLSLFLSFPFPLTLLLELRSAHTRVYNVATLRESAASRSRNRRSYLSLFLSVAQWLARSLARARSRSLTHLYASDAGRSTAGVYESPSHIHSWRAVSLARSHPRVLPVMPRDALAHV